MRPGNRSTTCNISPVEVWRVTGSHIRTTFAYTHHVWLTRTIVRIYAPRALAKLHGNVAATSIESKIIAHENCIPNTVSPPQWSLRSYNIINKSRHHNKYLPRIFVFIIVRFHSVARMSRRHEATKCMNIFADRINCCKPRHEMMKTRVWVRGIISPKLRRTPCWKFVRASYFGLGTIHFADSLLSFLSRDRRVWIRWQG